MKTKEEIQEKIDELLSDERLSYKTANILENAPLALIQYGLETIIHTLQDVIGAELTNFRKLRNEN